MIDQIRVYRSTSNYRVLEILKDSLKGYKNSFYLAKQLAKRDINAQYRQSILGIFWAIAPVLMSAAVWIFLNKTGTIKLSETKIPYPLFVVIGSTLWTVFNDCLLMSINSVNANKGIITKINFDKEALISLGAIKLVINLLIKLVLVIVLMLIYKVSLTVTFIYFIPLLIMSMLAFMSVGLLLTPIGILYTDIGRLITVAMQILMYLTPVVYNVPKEGLMKVIMDWNPLTYIVTNLRNTLTGFNIEHIPFMIGFAIVTLFISMFSMVVYRIAIPIITERMSA